MPKNTHKVVIRKKSKKFLQYEVLVFDMAIGWSRLVAGFGRHEHANMFAKELCAYYSVDGDVRLDDETNGAE